jgi:hypothetical protein
MMRLAIRLTSFFKSCDYLPRSCRHRARTLYWHSCHWDEAEVGRKMGVTWANPLTQAQQRI